MTFRVECGKQVPGHGTVTVLEVDLLVGRLMEELFPQCCSMRGGGLGQLT